MSEEKNWRRRGSRNCQSSVASIKLKKYLKQRIVVFDTELFPYLLPQARADQIKQQEAKQEVAMQQRKEQLESMRYHYLEKIFYKSKYYKNMK